MATAVDWAQIIGAVGSVIAIIVSGVALWVSRRQAAAALLADQQHAAEALRVAQEQAAAATRQLIHDRRVQFDLSVMRELVDIFSTEPEAAVRGRISPPRVRAVTLVYLIRNPLPLTRTILGSAPDPEAVQVIDDAQKKGRGWEGLIAFEVVRELAGAMTSLADSSAD
jgi:type II secretory pathway pseudopilin PulG